MHILRGVGGRAAYFTRLRRKLGRVHVARAEIGDVFEAQHTGQPFTPTLVQECAVFLTHQGAHSYRAYTINLVRSAELSQHSLLLVTPTVQ